MKIHHCAKGAGIWGGIMLLAASLVSASAFCVRDGSFNPATFSSGGTVNAVVTQSDGKVVVGGSFTFNGTYPNGYPFTANNLVRFNFDGTVDTSYNPSPNGSVMAMVIQPDGKIIIGGSFSQVGGLTQTAISRLTTGGGPDYINFQAPAPNYYVYALALQSDGKVLVGGGFTTMGGASYARLARLKSSGGLDSLFNPGVYGSSSAGVWSIAVYPDGTPSAGKIVIGGDFTSVGGYSRVNVAKINSSGTTDTGFNMSPNNVNGPVYAVAPDYGPFTINGASNVEKLLIGGAFTDYAGGRSYFARINSDGTPENNTEGNRVNGVVRSIQVQSDFGILLGGAFTESQGSTRNGVTRLIQNQDLIGVDFNWSDCTPNGAGGGTVQTIALSSSGRIYLGGNFTSFEGAAPAKVARLYAATPQLLNLGVLDGRTGSFGLGISDSGRAAGYSDDRAFRTSPNAAIDGSAGSPDDVHASLQSLVPVVSASRGFDIKQGNAIEVVGEAYDITNWRPFWYFESANGAQKAARILYNGVGAALSVIPGPTPGAASAVVGWARVNGVDNAAYWSVITNQHWLYNYGNNFFPNTNSYATDTDVNRTVGYFGNLGVYKAFILDGSIRLLSTPSGATATAAMGMKTVGTTSRVVGYYINGGLTKPVSWTYTGSGNSTHVALALPAGKTQGVARGVNDLGAIVGSAWSSDPSDEVACVWSSSGAVTTLNAVVNDANWNLIRADKVNSESAGRKIVGYGSYSGGGSPVFRGFVLSNWD